MRAGPSRRRERRQRPGPGRDRAASTWGRSKTTARTSAFIAADGTPVIFLAGIPGYHRLDRVRPYDGTAGDVECLRAAGDFVCRSCERVPRDHPPDPEHLAAGGVPFLVVGCDGRMYEL